MAAIRIQNLKKNYPNGVEALKGIDLTVEFGDFFALLGVNGAGKSTTIGALTTLLNKTSGKIIIQGYDLDTHPEKAKSQLGVVPQEINLNIFESCEEVLLNQAGYYGISRRQALPHMHFLLESLSLTHKRRATVRSLSGGMKRRLMIARALIHQPSILILDEPTAGVDIEIRRSMWDFLTHTNAQGTTIILTTHYLEEAEQLCNKVAIIDEGLLIQNTDMQTLLKTRQHQTFVFQTEQALPAHLEIAPFDVQIVDTHTFELRTDVHSTLNDIFARLSAQSIRVISMRNKTNRLESLFMDIIHHEH
ncbi:MAG: ABC transporter ATP-binding protein [Legionellaceae bacterium]|nr:ABC transporter ATP-binding protein [Legionellaceae bacterium]